MIRALVFLAVALVSGGGLVPEALWCQGEPLIVVHGDAWVRGEKIYLRDVAELGVPDPLQKRLGDTYLALAPDPGKTKTLPGSWVASKIRSVAVLPDSVAVQVPDYIRVGRAFQDIGEEALSQWYKDYVGRRLKRSDVDFEISRFRVTGAGPVPEGEIDMELSVQNDAPFAGNVSLNALVRVDGKVERRLVLSAWIDLFENVVCTSGPVPRQGVLEEGDLVLEKRNTAKLPYNVIRSLDEAVGKRVKHAVRAGEALLANDVEEAPLVQKGDRVIVVAESASLLIRTVGIAQGPGSSGDQIRVKNLTSNREIIASVVDSSTVKVEF